MKKLPNATIGFTLIELLVVIAIIAILAVMGFAAFAGLTGRGNDGRRMVDIKAIADALEVKKGTNVYYQSITADDFASGIFPKEPDTSSGRFAKYCYKDSDTGIVDNPGTWTVDHCPAGWDDLNNETGITVGSTAKYFKVCTMKTDQTTVICQGSRQ